MYISDRTLRHLRAVTERYEILEPVGEGATGVVYAALDNELGRRVALKVMKTAEAESRILAQLEHPGVVPVYDTGTLPDGRAFYAMKLIEGVRLDAYSRGEHSLNERLRVFARICEPVAFAHARGVFHRDLKPANIMIGSFGEVLVLDWGMGTVIGTPGFMPSEQEAGGVDARSDIYALGRILEIVAGAGAPKAVRAIGRKASAERPEDRYQTVAALLADIESFLDGGPVSAYAEGPAERLLRFLKRNRALAALLAVYVVIRMVIFLFAGR